MVQLQLARGAPLFANRVCVRHAPQRIAPAPAELSC
jgi:hypothetical protein